LSTIKCAWFAQKLSTISGFIYAWRYTINSSHQRQMYHFYLLRCRDNSLYAGIAKNLAQRSAAHNAGRGSAYVRSRGGGVIVYSERFRSKSRALKREAAVKKWPKPKKEQLVAGKPLGRKSNLPKSAVR